MLIKYTVVDPAKNITIIVRTPVDNKNRRFVASEILKKEPQAEQLGFISLDGDIAVLDMAGGEFCGNATRSASYLTNCSKVICSGQLIECDGSAAFIPKNQKGIHHLVLDKMLLESNGKAFYEEYIKQMALEYNSAVGLMFLDESDMSLIPLVYVPGIETLFWENSCASGSAAVANYLCEKYERAIDCKLSQPGGIICVSTSPESDFVKLSGDISIVKDSEIELEI